MQDSIQLKFKFGLKYDLSKKIDDIKYVNDMQFKVLNLRPDESIDKETLEAMKNKIQELGLKHQKNLNPDKK